MYDNVSNIILLLIQNFKVNYFFIVEQYDSFTISNEKYEIGLKNGSVTGFEPFVWKNSFYAMTFDLEIYRLRNEGEKIFQNIF